MRFDVYVDGSYNKEKSEGYGAYVVVVNETPIRAQRCITSNHVYTDSWNVGMELLATMCALGCMQQALQPKSVDTVKIFYDYRGIKEFIQGNPRWKAKTDVAKIYVQAVEQFVKSFPLVSLEFVKVKAHTGVKWNEVVDRLAAGERPVACEKVIAAEVKV